MGKAHWVTPGTALQIWYRLAILQLEADDERHVVFSRTHKIIYMDNSSRGYINYRRLGDTNIYIYLWNIIEV